MIEVGQIRVSNSSVFAAMFGVSGAHVGASAKATVTIQPSPYSLMAMQTGNVSHTFEISSGSSNIQVNGGGTYTASSAADGLSVSGGAKLNTCNEKTPPPCTGGIN